MGFTHSTKLLLSQFFILILLALNFTQISGLPGRDLLQKENASRPIRHSDGTVRPDPLDHLHKYREGYDIRNAHYWSSTVYTGIPGYAIGAAWLLCGVGYGGFLLIASCFSRIDERKLKKKTKTKRSANYKLRYLWSILLASFFAILAIVGMGVVLGENMRFRSKAQTVVDIIIDTADEAAGTIHNITGVFRDIRQNLETANVAAAASNFLSSTSRKLDVGAANIQREAGKRRRLIDKILDIIYIVTTVIISVNLVAVIALSVSGILKFGRTLQWLIALCWLLTVLCWVFFGVYFFLGKFSGDSCRALIDFRQNPYNSSLGYILPCDELVHSAKPVLSEVSSGIYNLVEQVNENISSLKRRISLKLPRVCNPFSGPPEYQFQHGNCPDGTIPISKIPEVLEMFNCSDGCKDGQFIPPRDFKIVEIYTTSIQSLLNVYPGMENMVECQMVKDAFSEILIKHCRPLKRYVRIVWAAMIFLSLVMVVLVLVWMIKSCHEQRHFADGSVRPDSSIANMVE